MKVIANREGCYSELKIYFEIANLVFFNNPNIKGNLFVYL